MFTTGAVEHEAGIQLFLIQGIGFKDGCGTEINLENNLEFCLFIFHLSCLEYLTAPHSLLPRLTFFFCTYEWFLFLHAAVIYLPGTPTREYKMLHIIPDVISLIFCFTNGL